MGIRQKASELALHMRKSDPNVSLVTVDKRKFYVYRYEGNLNKISNAVVLLSYPEECFGNPKALRIFISTDVSLSTQEILDSYAKRWSIELFFRQSKQKLGLDKYQIRSSQGIQRYWLIMSLTHYLCCMCKGKYCTFEEGYFYLQEQLKEERITAIYRLIQHGASLKDVLMIAG